MTPIADALKSPVRTLVAGVPEGLDGQVLAEIARTSPSRRLIHVARDDLRLSAAAEAIRFFDGDARIVRFPAWDCLPFDRVSPRTGIVAARLRALARLIELKDDGRPVIVLTTVNGALQRVPARQTIADACYRARPGNRLSTDRLQDFLVQNGYSRTGTVVDPGDFAVRGGIIDLFPPGTDEPLRLDFFGDTLESIRTFDVQSQRSSGQLQELRLEPASEILLNDEAITRFRTGYTARFGVAGSDDVLYEAISAGRRYQGMEHWLALFHDSLETLFDYVPGHVISLDHQIDDAVASRLDQIKEYHQARKDALEQKTFGAAPYKPLPPALMYLDATGWTDALAARPVLALSPFEAPATTGLSAVSAGARQGRSFAAERAREERNVYEAVAGHIDALRKDGKRVLVAAWSDGAAERLETILRDHGVAPAARAENWAEAAGRKRVVVSVVVLGLESGFETPDFAIIGEQDILGDRLVRRSNRKRRASDFLTEVSSLEPGDLIVHIEHGIGRFEGLKTIEIQGAPHDCLFLTYAGGDRLFLPVENIELLSRFGSGDAAAQLDRLGSGNWQARKAKLKERVREIAGQLINTAAARALKKGAVITPPEGLYDEFCARFAFEETEDQLNAVEDTLSDLANGRPMDRLICGDVGFGKTEIALRAAFATVMTGRQVAVVVPTTLLARQHFQTFSERFQGYPVNIAQASRLVGRKAINEARKGMACGDVDIMIGTHALLTADSRFHDLGLLIIDEEQHFGVKHKERIKELRADVHVLTLTATPIPRTLQLALSGVRELSLITTPPLDRLAVRTFISPFDPVVIRETMLREHFRGGQSFYVVPRIADLGEVARFLAENVPEVKVAVANGQMAPTELDDIMTAFYDRKFDVLLATTIIESGLDIPTANTLIVHKSQMFGLAQLYQLRGRVGRSKQRAYALFTLPSRTALSDSAEKRLKVLQSLDTLGAGFSLASHDLDIRGAGNLLGEEQSGHIREVGFALYQSMLEEAVASHNATGDDGDDDDGVWSPQINIGTSVMIPEHYVPDLQLRLGLYRRLSSLDDQTALEGFAAELHDRFGPLPEEVNHLLDILSIKLLCRLAGVETIDAGPKGAVIGLRNSKFARPEHLINWITHQGTLAKLRPDMKLVIMRQWATPADRLKGARLILKNLVELAGATI